MKSISFIVPQLRRIETVSADAIVLFRFATKEPLATITSLVDWRLYGHLSRLVIEDFLTGQDEELFLMPLGRHLPQKTLLMLGMGDPENFNRQLFEKQLKRMFDTLNDLNYNDILMTLPGRTEEVVDTATAIEWFLGVYDENWTRNITLIESTGAQKAMLPTVERWRMKQAMT